MAAVVAYHLSASALPGGYLGVDVFFVLSGFLITRLLVEERTTTGRIRLGGFWSRRARRLLPGLYLVLLALAVTAILIPQVVDPAQLRSDGLAALFYVANWHFLAVGQTYFGQMSTPSPLEHTWTLAIEEQFYLLWPLALLGMYALASRVRAARDVPRTLLVPTGLAALASLACMALVYDGGRGLEQAYFGTECRAFELLIGALAALTLRAFTGGGDEARDLAREPGRLSHPLVQLGGLVGLVGLAVAFFFASPGAFIFDGGLGLVAVASALLVIASLAPGPVSALFSLTPLRFIGRISYEIYLWHWPVIVVVDGQWHLAGVTRVLAVIGPTLVLAAGSHFLVDAPLRRADYRSAWRRFALPSAMGVTAAALFLAVPLDAAATAPPSAASLGEVASHTSGSSLTAAAQPAKLGPSTVFGVKLSAPTGHIKLDFKASRTRRVRVMYVGDSVMYQLELAIGAALDSTDEAVTAADGAILGWSPRGRRDFAQLESEIERYHPQVVVGEWSQDNTWLGNNGVTAYEHRVLGPLLDMLLKPGDGVEGVILAAEPPQPPLGSWMPDVHALVYDPKGMREWEEAARQESRLRPGKVAFVPATQMLELSNHYTTWLPSPGGKIERVREIDDFHLCLNGGVRYGAGVAAGVVGLLGLPEPKANWWLGSYATAKRWYQLPGYPPGQCPNDPPKQLHGTPG